MPSLNQILYCLQAILTGEVIANIKFSAVFTLGEKRPRGLSALDSSSQAPQERRIPYCAGQYHKIG
jgi:hypothetical protein